MTARAQKQQITLERTYPATREEVWELWTTRGGIESWWGPDGFTVEVGELDVRPGGALTYTMTATGAPQVEFMERAGMPLSTALQVTYTEVDPPRRLAFDSLVDFVPDVEPYPTTTVVDLEPVAHGVRVVVRIDAMHDDNWTERAVAGWEMELDRLAGVLAR
jgi:uncharacterized protein YndB with AHSA1/START domain